MEREDNNNQQPTTNKIMKTITPSEANKRGFATFNDVPHTCIDLQDGNQTITFKTSEGKLMTIAFLEYENGKAPQCVDIVSHEHATLEHETFAQDIRVFNKGFTPYCHIPSDENRDDRVKENPPTITTVIFLPTK